MKFKLSALMMCAALLAGCGGMPETVVQTPLTAKPQSASSITPPMNGAIFQTASYRPMFEDRRARLIGDTITMTVTVIDVLSNGNLVVAGEKQVALDKGGEFIRFSGVVDPATVGPGNIVSSTRVADARIEYRTNARIDAAEVMSMLARFFLSVMPL